MSQLEQTTVGSTMLRSSSARLTLLMLTLTWAFLCLSANNPAQIEATHINIYKHRYPFYGGYGYYPFWGGGYGGYGIGFGGGFGGYGR